MSRTRVEAQLAAGRVSRRWPLISAGIAAGLVVVLALLVWLRQGPLSVDEGWALEVREEPTSLLDIVSYFMNYIGGGPIAVFVIPILGAVLLLVVRRPWAALYWILTLALSAGAVQLVKQLVGRARPEDILVVSDFGSFPSGHTANAATIAVVLGVLFPRALMWIAGAAWVALMAFTRTYLGAHWLTDTFGGLLIGVCVALIVWAPFANRLFRERYTGLLASHSSDAR